MENGGGYMYVFTALTSSPEDSSMLLKHLIVYHTRAGPEGPPSSLPLYTTLELVQSVRHRLPLELVQSVRHRLLH